MARYGMLINTKKCTGCYTCVEACQNQNNLNDDMNYIHYERREMGTYPSVHAEVVPMQCMHCEDAPCQTVCPTGATYTTDDGIVLVDQEMCIGCLYCVAACPYEAREKNEITGTVEKCRFCAVKEEQGGNPTSCVEACLTGARIFGDLDDPDSEISKTIMKTNAAPLAGSLTAAKIYYVR